MNGKAVWIRAVVGVLAVAAVVGGWLATRSPVAEPAAGERPVVATAAGGGTDSSGDSASTPPANTTVYPVEEPAPSPGGPAQVVAAAGGEVPGPARVERVTIRDLFDQRDRYDGMTVIVRGRIVTQCVRGCRFDLDDGTGTLFVELVDEALERVLPRGSIGRRIEVRGVFRAAPRPTITVNDPDGIGWQ